ncbi:MAG: DUF1549 domain-containing protein [Planctomycetota bacterium]|nr:MAG: DUF1549 domain-containing protein [Planctomycetota bacterium]
MVGAEIAFLLLVQVQPTTLQDVADSLDKAVQQIRGYVPPEAPIVDDETFLKRVFKDLIDAAPSAAETQAFVADGTPDKRARAVDRLLDDDRFADFWSKRFSRAFFGDPEKPRPLQILDKPPRIELRLVQGYQAWLRGKLKKDTPWTQIVSETLDARGTTEGDPAVGYLLSFYRGEGAPLEFAQGVARDFLGIQLYCAKCHDHPFDKWRQEEFTSLAAFLARQEARGAGGEIVVRYLGSGELTDPAGKIAEPKFLFGGKAGGNDDRMKALANFMSMKGNTQLPRALANRVWGWLFGAGIVNPVDDFNLKNRAVAPVVLHTLVKDQAENNSSLKRLVRVICATKSYQRASPEEAPGTMSFRHLVGARGNFGRLVPLEANAPKPPLHLEVHKAWLPVRALYGATAMYLVRGKANGELTAEVSLHKGKVDKQLIERNARQFTKPQWSSAPLEAGSAVTLHEISGLCPCIDTGSLPWAVWAAAVETPKESYTLKFEGQAAVLAEWREEFVALLKSAR